VGWRTFFGDKEPVEAAAAAVEGRAGDAVEERRTGEAPALRSTGSPP
jgi:hypothetical protein